MKTNVQYLFNPRAVFKLQTSKYFESIQKEIYIQRIKLDNIRFNAVVRELDVQESGNEHKFPTLGTVFWYIIGRYLCVK